MGSGLVKPSNLGKKIDDAEAAALTPTTPAKPVPSTDDDTPITADAAAARQKARQAASDANMKQGMVKPTGILGTLKKMITGD